MAGIWEDSNFWSSKFLLFQWHSISRVWFTKTQCLKVLRCPFTFKTTVTAVWQSRGIMMRKTFRTGSGINRCHLSSGDFFPAKMPMKIIGINLFCLELYIEIISYLGKWYKFIESMSEKMHLMKKTIRKKEHLIKKTISYAVWWPLRNVLSNSFIISL